MLDCVALEGANVAEGEVVPMQTVEAPGEEEAEGSAGVGGCVRSKVKRRSRDLMWLVVMVKEGGRGGG